MDNEFNERAWVLLFAIACSLPLIALMTEAARVAR